MSVREAPPHNGLLCPIITTEQSPSHHQTAHGSQELTEKNNADQAEKNNTTFSKHVQLKIRS